MYFATLYLYVIDQLFLCYTIEIFYICLNIFHSKHSIPINSTSLCIHFSNKLQKVMGPACGMDASRIRILASEADWPIWKRKIRDLLDYHEGCLDAIDGKLTKPESLPDRPTDAELKAHKIKEDFYRKANSYAKTMLTSSITDAVYQKVMDKETAHDTWKALKEQFEATSRDQLFKICTDFFAFNWDQNQDVSTHVAILRGLWNELNNGLKAKGENPLPDLILLCKTLNILPLKFESFRSSWMLCQKMTTRLSTS